MTIAHVDSSDELNLLVQELGEHSDEESLGVVEESNAKEDESTNIFKRIIIHFWRSRVSTQEWPR